MTGTVFIDELNLTVPPADPGEEVTVTVDYAIGGFIHVGDLYTCGATSVELDYEVRLYLDGGLLATADRCDEPGGTFADSFSQSFDLFAPGNTGTYTIDVELVAQGTYPADDYVMASETATLNVDADGEMYVRSLYTSPRRITSDTDEIEIEAVVENTYDSGRHALLVFTFDDNQFDFENFSLDAGDTKLLTTTYSDIDISAGVTSHEICARLDLGTFY